MFINITRFNIGTSLKLIKNIIAKKKISDKKSDRSTEKKNCGTNLNYKLQHY